jgi:LysM repeat protein
MFVLALLITVSSAIFGHISASQASSAHTPAVATSVVIVQPGQTMWGLAAQVAPNDDPRDTIERIAQLNSLTGAQSSTVYPGQRLVVPATA